MGVGSTESWGQGNKESFGFSGNGKGEKAGTEFDTGTVTRFERGDSLHFCVDQSRMLTMFNVTKEEIYTVGPVPDSACYLHITLSGPDTGVVLAPMTPQERRNMIPKLGMNPC